MFDGRLRIAPDCDSNLLIIFEAFVFSCENFSNGGWKRLLQVLKRLHDLLIRVQPSQVDPYMASGGQSHPVHSASPLESLAAFTPFPEQNRVTNRNAAIRCAHRRDLHELRRVVENGLN